MTRYGGLTTTDAVRNDLTVVTNLHGELPCLASQQVLVLILEAAKALAVGADETDDVRCDVARRIHPLVRALRRDTWEVESEHLLGNSAV